MSEFLVWQREEFVQNSKFMEKLKRGGVDRITAEIPEEVLVFFEDCDIDTSTCEQKPEHDSSRASADYAAGGVWGRAKRGCHYAARLARR